MKVSQMAVWQIALNSWKLTTNIILLSSCKSIPDVDELFLAAFYYITCKENMSQPKRLASFCMNLRWL